MATEKILSLFHEVWGKSAEHIYLKPMWQKLHDLLSELIAEKHTAYTERNQMVAALSKVWPSHWCLHPAEDTSWDNDWRTIICVHSPAGQLTWHIKLSEQYLFSHLPKGGNHWDGHTTVEKYQRLQNVTPSVDFLTRPQGQQFPAEWHCIFCNYGEYVTNGEWARAMARRGEHEMHCTAMPQPMLPTPMPAPLTVKSPSCSIGEHNRCPTQFDTWRCGCQCHG